MVEPSDALINGDRPVVQDSDRDEYLELHLPSLGETVEMHYEVFMAVFGEGMRIATQTDAETVRDGVRDDE